MTYLGALWDVVKAFICCLLPNIGAPRALR